MDEESTGNTSDDVHHVVDKLRMNLKSSHVDMIERSTSDNFFNNISTIRGSGEIKNDSDEYKRHRLKSIELISNDREIPDFLRHSDDEDFHVLSGSNSVTMFSRSTQTRVSDIKNEPRISRGHAFNYPATIVNGELSNTRVSPSIPFYQELMLTRSQLNSIHHNYQTVKKRFYQLHADYEKLMGIAAELTTSLENSVRGQSVDVRTTLQACMKIYPELFNHNVRNDDKLKSSVGESKIDYLDKNLKISMLSTVPLSPKDLNYKKIKLHLIHGNIRTKLLLLQALRWKITLSQPGERDEAIIEYIHNDLLGIHGQIAGDSGKSILPYILIPLDIVVPHPVQQSAARLLNTFASFKCGRDYLAVGPNVLNVVIQCLDSTHAESIDAFTCDMIIATLQKLSLRKHQRLYMISAGMIEWLIHHLKAECHSMGTYRLEYATALLMNLSLHKEAQIRAAVIAMMLVSTLIALLSLQHLPALPYVYGALNNFLANSAIDDEANAIGLKSILEHHRNYRTGELRKHLDHILLRYRRKFNHTIEEEIYDDDDREENDILEDELDEMDSVKVHAGELFGEGLLATCYSVSPYVKRIDDNKLTYGSSPDASFKTGDEFNTVREDENLFEDRYLSFHSQILSPRLTPIHCKSKISNPAHLNITARSDSDKTSNENSGETIFVTKDKPRYTTSEISQSNDFLAATDSVIMLDQLYFRRDPNKNYKEKVMNSFNTCHVNDKEFLSMKSKDIKKSETNSWILWDMSTNETKNSKQSKVSHSERCLLHELENVSESTPYIHENKKSKESSITVINSGINASSTIVDSAFEGADTLVVEERMSSIASLEINFDDGSNYQPVIELTEEQEAAFAAKPRISRTPPQSVSSTGRHELVETSAEFSN